MNGIITEINSKFLEILGYSKNEVIGRNIIDFVVAEQREKAAEQLAKDFKGEKSPEMDVDMLAKDGSNRTILCSRGPALLYEGDAPAGFLLITVIDITDRKRAEDALKMALSEVEKLKNRLEDENLYLQNEIKLTHNFEEIIGKSEALKNILGKVQQVAATDSTVLILGETGTGKELIARAVHNISGRSDRPLVKVNCAALPANIIESELFGHEKGAFTGAFARKIGRFELADKGTIFLDEIGDLPIDLQVKLLRVLQDGEFERLGNPNTIKVDIRIIAATNRDLEKAIENSTFREDLYYRLNVFPIKAPSLRERKEDIPFLVNHFIKKYCKKIGRKIEIIPQKVMDGLLTYDWPGNIRELENIIERAVIVCQGKRLEAGDWLPQKCMPAGASSITTLEEMEKAHILKVLELTRWQVSGEKGAAKILGLNQNTLVSRMKKLNIHR
jgi:PAS domain S-box-containing protein